MNVVRLGGTSTSVNKILHDLVNTIHQHRMTTLNSNRARETGLRRGHSVTCQTVA